MVKICSNHYSIKSQEKYNSYFDKYSFDLSSFQKYAIEAIVEGNHILITAHTGSGKTLPAEFAIEYFIKLGKKVIYTSPIKALSNQKFYDFQQKFPNISFGLLTGDIKCNPEADVLIMTAEILLNKLYQTSTISSTISFDMDIEKDLGCVIMDEVHYINDHDRGKVWEETIMMLPLQIQMVMLSATLDSPEKFASWCETKGNFINNPEKMVYLASTHERVVPLTHYSFITVNNSIFKLEKDKSIQESIKKFINKPHILQDSKGKFNDETFISTNKMLKMFHKNQFVKKHHVLNQVSKYLFENEMLPALCFVFSRKMLEEYANNLTTNLLEFDSKVPYIIQKECEQIIRKIPNYEEYLQLPEYIHMVSLLQKGIAIHHAGIMPILREMVELLYSKGYIKFLFATETFAVGINMPTKTVLFSSLEKWDGNHSRLLYAHEYTQMAGRAGRRGIDTVGHVIHLNNLFDSIDIVNYKTIMKGQPQKLISKFKISYNLLLNLINIKNYNFTDYAKRSMIQNDLTSECNKYYYKMNEILQELELIYNKIPTLNTPVDIIHDYIKFLNNKTASMNSKRKEIEKQIGKIEEQYKYIKNEKQIIISLIDKQKEYDLIKFNIDTQEQFINKTILSVLQLLEEEEFIIKDKDPYNYQLSLKGQIANQLKELPCLIIADLILKDKFKSLNVNEIIGIFSCFTNISVTENVKDIQPMNTTIKIKNILMDIVNKNEKQIIKELNKNIQTGTEFTIQFDIIKYSMDWCDCENISDCKLILQDMYNTKQIFLGEFIKAILKINNISNELEKVAELIGDMELLQVLKQVSVKTLKYIATNQSLYI